MILSINKNTLRQFIFFSVIGGIGTLAHYMVLIGLVEGFTYSPTLASLIGAIVGACINYILNYKFTFQSQQAHKTTMTRFMIIATLGAGLNTLLMYLFTEALLVQYLLAQVITTVIVLLWNFIMNKCWTFGTN